MAFWHLLETHGERPALISPDQTLSYADLAAQADRFAGDARALLPAGLIRPLILMETANEIAPILAYLGALRAGWPVILLADGASAADSRILDTYAPDLVFRRGPEGWKATLTGAGQAHDLHPDLRVLLSTSGTTGAAKLVRLSEANLAANAEAIASYLDVRADDRAITSLPFHYSYGMSVLHIHLLRGAALVLSEASVIDPAFQGALRRFGVTSLALVPVQFDLLEKAGLATAALPDLRYITQAGGKLNSGLARSFAARSRAEGWKFYIMYGQTEAAPRISYVPPEDVGTAFDTIGRPVPGGTLRLIDADGAEISAVNTAGELIYEGPNVMMGYALSSGDLGQPATVANLHTGDIAERLGNGYFRIVGRASRFIKLFGLRVSLDEIENTLRSEGRDVLCSGSDDRLVVFLLDGSAPDPLQRAIVERYKLTDSVVAVTPLDAAPLLSSGKIDYKRLSDLAAALPTASVAAAEDLLAVLKNALKTPSPNMNKSFLAQGGDSLAYLEVQMSLAARLGQVPDSWEALPLRDLLVLTPQATRARSQPLPADLVFQVLALMAVIALHTTPWHSGGGAYLLLVLAGYSLARFQHEGLFAGRVGAMLKAMLTPILVGYFGLLFLINLVWAPVDTEWFLLLGNFDGDIHPRTLLPYWFVCAYAQIIVLFGLPFLLPRLRARISAAPFVAGVVLVVGLGLVMLVAGPDRLPFSERHHHPLAALQLLGLGWTIYFARSRERQLGVAALLAAVWLINWHGAPPQVTGLVMVGLLAVIAQVRVPLPRFLARGLMQVGSLTMFIYLAHVPVGATVLDFLRDPPLLAFLVITAISIAVSMGLKLAYDTTVMRILPRIWQSLCQLRPTSRRIP